MVGITWSHIGLAQAENMLAYRVRRFDPAVLLLWCRYGKREAIRAEYADETPGSFGADAVSAVHGRARLRRTQSYAGIWVTP